jgi:L-amino acid N-acyltransferase YncA
MKHYSDEYPKEATIKDGRAISIRILTPDYEDLLVEFFANQKKKDLMYLKSDMRDTNEVRKYVQRRNVLRLIAARNKTILGIASLYFDPDGWSAHVGEMRCIVRSGMHGLGIATTLLRELVRVSQLTGIDKSIALIPAGDSHTRKIYRRLGFRQEAVLKSHVKDWRGSLHDLVICSRHTDDLWHQMDELVSYFRPE